MDLMEARVGAIGHSHVALWFHRDADGEVTGAQAGAGSEQDVSEGKWLMNPGGVGQPRDGDPRASWLLLDTGDWTATWRRVEYPIEQAARAIEDAGLPGVLAERLYADSDSAQRDNHILCARGRPGRGLRLRRRGRADPRSDRRPRSRTSSTGSQERLAVQGACNDITEGDDAQHEGVDDLIADSPRTWTPTWSRRSATASTTSSTSSTSAVRAGQGARPDRDRDHADRDADGDPAPRQPPRRRCRRRPRRDDHVDLSPTRTPPPSRGARPGRRRTGRQRRRQRRRRPGGGRVMSPPTQVAGRYVLERRLGAGGMSTVFQANDTVLERPVAVKLLAEHLADDEAFVYALPPRGPGRGAAPAPEHRAGVRLGPGPELAPPLHRHGVRGRALVPPTCCASASGSTSTRPSGIVRDACHGLDYAHRAGVVHRDVKPGNLLFAEEMGTTKLADFGIAKAAEQTRITQVGSVLGTAAYLSPEQARGEEAGPPSDIYSLGVCAYQFLTGRLPHEYASLTELALKQQQDPVDPITDYRPEVPPELDEAVRALRSSATPTRATPPRSRWPRPSRRACTARPPRPPQRLALSDRHHSGDRRHRRHAGAPSPAVPGAAPTRVAPSRRPRRRHARGGAPRRAGPRAGARARRRRWGTFLALLAVIAAVAVVALALLSSSERQRGPGPDRTTFSSRSTAARLHPGRARRSSTRLAVRVDALADRVAQAAASAAP